MDQKRGPGLINMSQGPVFRPFISLYLVCFPASRDLIPAAHKNYFHVGFKRLSFSLACI